MKKATVQVAYDEERFATLLMYMKQKNLSLDEELQKAMDGLYKKHVPVVVRRYFTLKEEGSAAATIKSKGE